MLVLHWLALPNTKAVLMRAPFASESLVMALSRRFKVRTSLEQNGLLRACQDSEFEHEAFPSVEELVHHVEGLATVKETLSKLSDYETKFGFHHPGHQFRGKKQPLETDEDLGVMNSLHETVSLRSPVYLFFRVIVLSPGTAARKRCSSGHLLPSTSSAVDGRGDHDAESGGLSTSASAAAGSSKVASLVAAKAGALNELKQRQESGRLGRQYSPEQLQVRASRLVRCDSCLALDPDSVCNCLAGLGLSLRGGASRQPG